jgi:hypothetical protein
VELEHPKPIRQALVCQQPLWESQLVKETVGEHATIVRLGDIDAALVESSTWPGDFRSHSLYWSDGRLDFSLMIGGSSEEVVKAAQSLYCG